MEHLKERFHILSRVGLATSTLTWTDIGHRTSDIGHQTSDIGHQTSDIRHQTSNIRHLRSDIIIWGVSCRAWRMRCSRPLPCQSTIVMMEDVPTHFVHLFRFTNILLLFGVLWLQQSSDCAAMPVTSHWPEVHYRLVRYHLETNCYRGEDSFQDVILPPSTRSIIYQARLAGKVKRRADVVCSLDS